MSALEIRKRKAPGAAGDMRWVCLMALLVACSPRPRQVVVVAPTDLVASDAEVPATSRDSAVRLALTSWLRRESGVWADPVAILRADSMATARVLPEDNRRYVLLDSAAIWHRALSRGGMVGFLHVARVHTAGDSIFVSLWSAFVIPERPGTHLNEGCEWVVVHGRHSLLGCLIV